LGSGVYALLIHCREGGEYQVGGLGSLRFEAGYYVYVGRAMRGLFARVRRHLLRPRRVRWHVDWLTSRGEFAPMTAVVGRTDDPRMEELLAEEIGGDPVRGFGCSDSHTETHLKYLGRDLTSARRECERALDRLGLTPEYHERGDIVFLDLDGTLCDYDVKRHEALRRLAPRWGLDPEALVEEYEEVRREIYAKLGDSPERYSKRLLFERLRTRLSVIPDPGRAEEEYWREVLEVVRPYPDVATLRELAEMGARLVLLTDGISRWQREKLRVIGLEPYFETVLTSEDLGINKTSPEAFRRALGVVGARPDEAIAVGDVLKSDVLSAQSAGVRGVWVNRRGKEAQGPLGAPQIENLRPLPRILVTSGR